MENGSVVTIKGTSVLDAFDGLRGRIGEDGFQEVLSLMDPAQRAFFSGPIVPMAWYPLDAFIDFLAASLERNAEDESILIARTAALVERQVRGVYRVFIRLGSPGFVVRRISNIHKTYFRGTVAEPRFEEERCAVVRYVGFRPHHALIENLIVGFYKGALEVSGAGSVEVRVTTPLKARRDHLEIGIRWT